MLQGYSLTINNKRMQSAICFIPQYFLLMLRIFHYALQWGDFSGIGIKLEYFADKIWLISSECVHLPTEQNSRISDIALTLSNECGLSTYHNADYHVAH